MPPRARTIALALFVAFSLPPVALADGVPQRLPFAQSWSQPAQIARDDDWSSVPGVVGRRGDDLASGTDVDPRTVLADGSSTPFDVIANQSRPDTLWSGGVAEFELSNPAVAFQPSATADAPHLVISLDTRGFRGVSFGYVLRDLDGSADDARQQVALQYRVGGSGEFVNVPEGFVGDATSPASATLATPVRVVLPAAADDRPLVEVRIVTTNAFGSDEWVGVDDLGATGSSRVGTPPSSPALPSPSDATESPSNEAGDVDATSAVAPSTVTAASEAGRAPPRLALSLAPVQRLARVLARGLRVGLRLSERCRVTVRLVLPARTARAFRLPRVVGSRAQSVAAGRTVTVRIRPAAPARRRLVRLRRVGLFVHLLATDADGNRARAARRITLVR